MLLLALYDNANNRMNAHNTLRLNHYYLCWCEVCTYRKRERKVSSTCYNYVQKLHASHGWCHNLFFEFWVSCTLVVLRYYWQYLCAILNSFLLKYIKLASMSLDISVLLISFLYNIFHAMIFLHFPPIAKFQSGTTKLSIVTVFQTLKNLTSASDECHMW